MKRLPFYPFLFILYIVLEPLNHNLGRLNAAQVLRPSIILCLVTVVGLGLLYLLGKDWQHASYIVFMVLLFFFTFGGVNQFIQDTLSIIGREIDDEIFLAVCTILLAILLVKRVWLRLSGHGKMILYLNIVVLLWLLFPSVGLVSDLFISTARAGISPRIGPVRTDFPQLDCSRSPDIYYVILDGYGRADMLKDLYRFDNQSFLAYLQDKGFYVADQSYTNYIQTVYSIPSSLNFNFIKPPDRELKSQVFFSNLIRNNKIMSVLQDCGYQTISFESGFYFTDHLKVDLYLQDAVGPTEFENLLLAGSPLDVLADELGLAPAKYSYEGHRQRVLYTINQLGNLPQDGPPKFIFAHIVSPHPPFVFDQHGYPTNPKYRYYIGDGDDYQGSLNEYLSGYPKQVEYVNQQLEQVIDTILGNSITPPVIIIQGDHGPGSRLVWDSPDQTCLWERTPILNAYYLPGDAAGSLYPSISPVNSFRVVLNTQFAANLPMLPDMTYFTSHHLERRAIDITSSRESREHCSTP